MKDGKKPWNSVLFWIPVVIALCIAVILVVLYDKDSLLYQLYEKIFHPKWVRLI